MSKQGKNMQPKNEKPQTPLKENGGVMMEGHIRIFDPETGEDIVNKRNAIHYENISIHRYWDLNKEIVFFTRASLT